VKRAAEHFGRLDVVVNNAGYAQVGAVEELTEREGLATRYDKLAIVYRSAVVLHAVITWTKALSDTP
jgi:NAD(P)-dependent dehydrogenase (short-subunit alcohol dehydrogenase family)